MLIINYISNLGLLMNFMKSVIIASLLNYSIGIFAMAATIANVSVDINHPSKNETLSLILTIPPNNKWCDQDGQMNDKELNNYVKNIIESVSQQVYAYACFHSNKRKQEAIHLQIDKTAEVALALDYYARLYGKDLRQYHKDYATCADDQVIYDCDNHYLLQLPVIQQKGTDISSLILSSFEAGYLAAFNRLSGKINQRVSFIQKYPLISVLSSFGIGAGVVGLAWWWKSTK